MTRTIFLDIDGVLADFAGGVCNLYGIDRDLAYESWPEGTYDVCDALGIDTEEMWMRIDARGVRFWEQLQPYPWAHEVFATCHEHGRVVLLTSPSYHWTSAAGKVAWIQRHLGPNFRDYLIGPPKHACAHDRAVLVDDSESNVRAFTQHGGQGITFPAPWNNRNEKPGADVVAQALRSIR